MRRSLGQWLDCLVYFRTWLSSVVDFGFESAFKFGLADRVIHSHRSESVNTFEMKLVLVFSITAPLLSSLVYAFHCCQRITFSIQYNCRKISAVQSLYRTFVRIFLLLFYL